MKTNKIQKLLIFRMGISFTDFCEVLRNANLNPSFKKLDEMEIGLVMQQNCTYGTPIKAGCRVYFAEIKLHPKKKIIHWLVEV